MELGHFRLWHKCEVPTGSEIVLVGEDRKSSAHSQNDATDPLRDSRQADVSAVKLWQLFCAHARRRAFFHAGVIMRHLATCVPGTGRPAKCCQKARIPGCAIRSVPRKTHMDTTTLLIIVLLILLLAGGGWYGRGR